jgi:glycosyltransferase involved in cell wall biosynthesis
VAERVEVLLSTFRSGPFLSQQLDSVWAQDYPEVALVVRDDGSGDGTVSQVEQCLSGRTRARFIAGEHTGAGKSFLALLRDVDPTTGYAAFCDQDDVWLPGKLSAAVELLRGQQGPTLYCSAVELVDRELRRIKTHRRCVRGPSFENALVENIATGCTIVLNRAAVALLSAEMPNDFLMHDAWCYLVVSGCGQVLYDPNPQVLYRLHSSNAIGVRPTVLSEWAGRARRHLAEGHERVLTRQALELKRLYGPLLRPDAVRSLDAFLEAGSSLPQRLRYALSGRAHRQRPVDDLVYRTLYAVHRI